MSIMYQKILILNIWVHKQSIQIVCILFHALAVLCDSSSYKMVLEINFDLSEDEVAAIKEHFKKMDVDGNGTVTSEEFKKVMKEDLEGEGIPESAMDVMVAMVDANGDGKINFEEFLQMATTG